MVASRASRPSRTALASPLLLIFDIGELALAFDSGVLAPGRGLAAPASGTAIPPWFFITTVRPCFVWSWIITAVGSYFVSWASWGGANIPNRIQWFRLSKPFLEQDYALHYSFGKVPGPDLQSVQSATPGLRVLMAAVAFEVTKWFCQYFGTAHEHSRFLHKLLVAVMPQPQHALVEGHNAHLGVLADAGPRRFM